MVVINLNRPCVVPACFADRWRRVQPAAFASPSAVDALARLADALATVTTVLEVVEAIPLEEVSTFIAVSPGHRRFVFPNIPHVYSIHRRVFTPTGRIVPPSTLSRSGKLETKLSNDIFRALSASVKFWRRSFSSLAAAEKDLPGPSASRRTSAYGRS